MKCRLLFVTSIISGKIFEKFPPIEMTKIQPRSRLKNVKVDLQGQ